MSGVTTVVLGVKTSAELNECLAAEAMGPLEPELVARIDASVREAGQHPFWRRSAQLSDCMNWTQKSYAPRWFVRWL